MSPGAPEPSPGRRHAAPPQGDHGDAHAEQIVTRGHAVLPGLVSSAEVDRLCDGLRRRWIEAGRPRLYSREDRPVGEGLVVSPVGMVISGLLGQIPALRHAMLHPALHRVLGAVLGPGYRLEMVVGVISDASRAFFRWHHHVGGIDAYDYRSRARYPRFQRSERVVCTAYGCPLDDAHGTMLVVPRRIDQPTEPPVDDLHAPGHGAERLGLAPGSVMVLEQATWHAITPMRTSGQRCLMAFYVARAEAPPTHRRDPAVDEALARYPELAEAFAAPPG